ncbi:hypothetical protein XELAEV_18029499mg [Xenopus laevis]|uniref:Uncharacterized protein n=1 Tax=Xenopus laevis TaxID=8355 RepID=A0A974CS74_XENLA|nr:hypothetical protein XELAEV_18029499mg [Xenopus laevis]
MIKVNGNQQNTLSRKTLPGENNRQPEVMEEKAQESSIQTAAPLKIPRIILTRPSTSDDDVEQLTQDQEDLEEADMVEDQLFLECVNNGP